MKTFADIIMAWCGVTGISTSLTNKTYYDLKETFKWRPRKWSNSIIFVNRHLWERWTSCRRTQQTAYQTSRDRRCHQSHHRRQSHHRLQLRLAPLFCYLETNVSVEPTECWETTQKLLAFTQCLSIIKWFSSDKRAREKLCKLPRTLLFVRLLESVRVDN